MEESDASLAALRSIEDCEQPERFGAWLLQIVRNRAHNARRHRAVRAAAPLEGAMHVHGGSDPMRDAEKTELRARRREEIRRRFPDGAPRPGMFLSR